MQLDEITLQRELGRLVEAELFYQRGVLPQATYIFKHALIQDAAYPSLLKSTRQHYHRQIAQVLVEQFPETAGTRPELLAHHYTEAGHIVQAIGYWQRAGEKATQASAHGVSCLTIGAQALWHLGYPDQALQRSLEALALAQEVAHPFSLVWAFSWTASLHWHRREYQAARERLEAAVALATEQGFTQWAAQGVILQGWALAAQRRGEEGIDHMR